MCAVILLTILLQLDFSHCQIVVARSDDVLIVLGRSNSFTRKCNYTGTESLDSWRWLNNGSTFSGHNTEVGTTSTLLFFPSSEDRGTYSCVALDSQMNELASASVGTLSLISEEDAAVVTPIQYVGRGEDIQLQCSSPVPNTIVAWQRGESIIGTSTYSITNASEADRGIYKCIVNINDNNIANNMVFLHVLIYPTILRTPGDMTLGNNRVTLEVEFESSYSNTTTVIWLRDGQRLPANLSGEVYESNGVKGTTVLTLDPARRSDSGSYEVEVFNRLDFIPTDRRSIFTPPFKVTVQVPPVTFQPPSLSMINSTFTLVRWTIPNNASLDAVPDRLLLELTNHSKPQIQLDLTSNETLVRTEPGVLYTATITSFNEDGSRTSAPATLFTTPTAPSVSEVLINRVDPTTFNVTVLVEYTGAGPSASLKLLDVEYRDPLAGVGGWLQIEQRIQLVRDATNATKWSTVLMHEGFSNLGMVEFMFGIQNDMINDIVSQQIQGVLVPPGPPVILNGTASTTSLHIVARLSREGTSPLSTLHTVITAAGHPTRALTKDDGLAVGEEVGVVITGLAPDVSYTVYMYVRNVAGQSPQSPQRIFTTSSEGTDFPVWLIALVAIVGSCALVALTLVILVSCYCRRHGKQELKMNLAAESVSHGVRQMPVGAIESGIEKVPSFPKYNTMNMKYSSVNVTDDKFILEAAPMGHSPLHNPPMFPSTVHEPYNSRSNYIYPMTKPRPHAGSFSGSDMSDHSTSKYFQYRQSPAHRSFITEDQLSHSMPVLEDPDLTPTMPPNCSTDV